MSRRTMPLTAAELLRHPEFKSAVWPLKPTEQGKVAVAAGRGGPINIAYEVHGSGPKHVVLIMGLGGYASAWQRQTKDFGHDQADQYSVLVFDNRGIGKSDKPLMRYSTSEMAKDVVELVDQLGWTGKRELHVVGISMGGMIAQELACLIPERIASLALVATAARLVNTIGFFENLRNRINMFIPKNIDLQLEQVKIRLFTDEWLTSPDAEGGFPTNGDRFAAQELHKRLDTEGFTRLGFTLQAIAAGWHHKSAEQLSKLADAVGRDRILVVHGTRDVMITVPHGQVLAHELGGEERGITKVILDVGHGLTMEGRDELKSLLSNLFDKTSAMP